MGMFRMMEPALRWLDERLNGERRSRWLHDARAPLASIVGVVEVLIHEARGEHRAYLDGIRASACQLLAQLDAGAAAACGHARSIELGGARILVVMEHEPVRREWLGALAERGYTPYGAIDALDALRQLTLESFDATLIDASLACLEAGLLARAIRSRPGVSRSMRIAAIGSGDPATFDFAVRSAAEFSVRGTAPTARAPHRRARARARG